MVLLQNTHSNISGQVDEAANLIKGKDCDNQKMVMK